MVIDMHSHVIPPSIISAIEADPSGLKAKVVELDGQRHIVHEQGYRYPLLPEFFDAHAKLASMDKRRIDISVVSPAPPLFYYWADPELALRVATLVNDGIADMVNAAPQRLRGMASLPMQHPDVAVTELERVVKTHGFKAVEIGTSIEGVQLADSRFRPVLRRAEELGVLVFAHPYYVGDKPGLECYYLTNLIGNPLDTATCVANLIFGGVMDELPQLDILLAHGGGFVPYQIGRLAHGHKVREETRQHQCSDPKTLLSRFYFDTLLFDPAAIRYLIDAVGADRLVIGTDSPFDMADADPLATLNAVERLTPQEHHAICCGTARRLLKEA